MASLDISTADDLNEVYGSLLSVGFPDYKAREVCMVLSQWNKGYTWTDYEGRYSLVFVSKATSAEQMYDTIQHEEKHIVEHVSSYFDVDPKSEEAAYLQGEVGRLLFPAAAMVVCPRCHRVR